MFCAGCGTQIQSGLNYCSRCGRRIAEEAADSGRGWSNPTVVAGQTAGVGFVGYIFVILVLSKTGAAPDVFKTVSFLYFAALFGLCFMFLRQGFSQARTKSVSDQKEISEPAYLRPVTTAQLHEGFDTPASVTDHTTRTLDEVPARKL